MKKLIIMMMVVVLTLSALFAFGCGKKEKATENSNIQIVYDFEKGTQGVRMVSTSNESFGKVLLNEDKNYVTSGNRSIKLIPNNRNTKPFIYLPFKSVFLEEDFSDIEKIVTVSMNMYSTGRAKIGVGCYFTERAENKSMATIYDIKEGWNTIKYKNELSLLQLQYNVKDFKGIYIRYEDNIQIPVTYIDDIKVEISKEELGSYDMVSLKATNDSYEIADFEFSYQNFIFISTSAYLPELNVVKAADEGLEAPSGEKILRIDPALNDTGSPTYARIFLADKFMEAINWDLFKGNLEDYVLKYDVYQKSTENIYIDINLYGDNIPVYDTIQGTRLKDQWVTISAPLTKFETFLTAPTKFTFVWANVNDPDYVIYIDNIRIEKINKGA